MTAADVAVVVDSAPSAPTFQEAWTVTSAEAAASSPAAPFAVIAVAEWVKSVGSDA